MQPYKYNYNPYEGNEQREVSLVSQTNPKEVLDEIESTLRGRKKIINEDTGKTEWILPMGCKPRANERGISSLMTDAKTIINQNTIMSNLSEEEISKIIISLSDTIINKLSMNWKEFEVAKSDLDTVHNAIIVPAFMALKRAMREGEKRFLKTSVRAVESYTSNSRPQQETSSDKIKFWRD